MHATQTTGSTTPALARLPLLRSPTTASVITTTIHASANASSNGSRVNSDDVHMHEWTGEDVSVYVLDDAVHPGRFVCQVEGVGKVVRLHRTLESFFELDARLRMTGKAEDKERLTDLTPLAPPAPPTTPSRRAFVTSLFASAPSTPTLKPHSHLDASTLLTEYMRNVFDVVGLRETLWVHEFLRVQAIAGDMVTERTPSMVNSPSQVLVSNGAGVGGASTPPMATHKPSLQDYALLRVLGRGCMGKVFLAREKKTSRLYALKTIAKHRLKRDRERTHVRSERDILATLAAAGRHPFLVALKASFQDMEQLYLVLEYHRGGDLAGELAKRQKFDDARVCFYAKEITLGIHALHRLGIIYRDLKPENVLLDKEGHVVLTDFGLSKQFPGDYEMGRGEDRRTDTFCGTAEYLAPEVLRGERYGFGVDWWSFGTLLYEMYFGTTPFWAEDHMAMYNRVLSDRLRFLGPIKPTARSLLSELLERNPRARLGYGTLGAQAIQAHPYFFGTDWTKVADKKYPPPYVPEAKDDEDLQHFDREFTDMTPRLSPPTMPGGDDATMGGGGAGGGQCSVRRVLPGGVNQELFVGFSYSDAALMGSSVPSEGVGMAEDDDDEGSIVVEEDSVGMEW